MALLASPGQIWQDNCYYLDANNHCQPKYVLILAVDPKSGDAVTVVFTSKPNGLPVSPACHIGLPRSGFYLGVPGGIFHKESWLDFNNLQTLDALDLAIHIKQSRKTLLNQQLSHTQFCQALRCISSMQEDITKYQWGLLRDTIERLGC